MSEKKSATQKAAPDFLDRDGQKRAAIQRLSGLCDRAAKKGKVKDVLEIQREINNLLTLGASDVGVLAKAQSDVSGNAPAESAALQLVSDVAAVRSHLEPLLVPLGLAAPGAPVGELARLAVQRIVELTSANGGKEKT